MKNYELYWKEIQVGSLVKTNFDMRDFGIISYKFDYLNEPSSNEHLAGYIKISILISLSFEEEEDEENTELLCEENDKYLDIINGSDWHLVNENREIIPILCPMFHEDNGVTWMRDPKRG